MLRTKVLLKIFLSFKASVLVTGKAKINPDIKPSKATSLQVLKAVT